MSLPQAQVYRSRVASSTGDGFYLFTGIGNTASGLVQPFFLISQSGDILNPATADDLQQISSQLSGLKIANLSGGHILVDSAQSGLWYLSNDSFLVGRSGAWPVNLTGTNVVTLNTGTLSVSVDNTPTVSLGGISRVGLSGENLVFVTNSGTFNATINAALPAGGNNIGKVTLETGVVSTSFAAGSSLGITNQSFSVGQSGAFTVILTGTNSVNIGNSPTVVITQPLNVNSAQSGVYSVGQSGAWTTVLTGTNLVTLNTGSVNINGSVSLVAGSQIGISGDSVVTLRTGVVQTNITNTSFPVNLTGTNTISLANGGIVGLSGDVNVTGGYFEITGVAQVSTTDTAKSYLHTGMGSGLYQIKSTSGSISDIHVFNPNSQQVYLWLYQIPTGILDLTNGTAIRKIWCPAGGAIDSSYATPISFVSGLSATASLNLDVVTNITSGLLLNLGYR